MSIPHEFNPLGTSTAEGYVTDGLILWFDALKEEEGERSYLTNWASGSQCVFNNNIIVRDGYITHGPDRAWFNPAPGNKIDGNPHVGLGYSADICATQGGYFSAVVWNCLKISGDYVLGFQVHYSNHGLRCQGGNGEMTAYPGYYYPLLAGKTYSFHLGRDTKTEMRQNGEVLNAISGNFTIGVDGYTAYLARNIKLHAYRLYNRQLSVEEQRQNYQLDKKRFNVL